MNGRQLIKKRNEKREREKYEFFVKFYSDLEKANNGRKLERYDNHWYIDYSDINNIKEKLQSEEPPKTKPVLGFFRYRIDCVELMSKYRKDIIKFLKESKYV